MKQQKAAQSMKAHSANAKWHHDETKKMLDEFKELKAKEVL